MSIQKGFTLIELIIAVVIIAILTAIAVPAYQGYITKAKIKEAQANLIALSLSAENAYQRTLNYPKVTLTGTAAITSNSVFNSWNPSSTSFNFKYSSTDGTTYRLEAVGTESRVNGCTVVLANNGVKTISGCGSMTDWVK